MYIIICYVIKLIIVYLHNASVGLIDKVLPYGSGAQKQDACFLILISWIRLPTGAEPDQGLSGSALYPSRQEVRGSIPYHACRPRCFEFSVVFVKARINTRQELLERYPKKAFPQRLKSHMQTIDLIPTAQPKKSILPFAVKCFEGKKEIFYII